MECPFCHKTDGKCDKTCISRQSNPLLEQFLAAKAKSDTVDADTLIEQYIGLMTAYAMTLDALEFAGKSLGRDRLKKLALLIENSVDAKIDEILAACEEEEDE